MGQHRWGATKLKLGRGFGLQAEVSFRRHAGPRNSSWMIQRGWKASVVGGYAEFRYLNHDLGPGRNTVDDPDVATND